MSAGGFPFVMELQQKPNWCWAGTAVSVKKYYESTSGWLQCLMVDDQLQRGCCEQPSACDEDGFLGAALDAAECLERIVSAPVALQPTVATEINALRPVVAAIIWEGGGRHAVVINAYTDEIISGFPGIVFHEKWVQVQDSEYGPSFVPYDTLRTSYHGSGTWTTTFFTKR
ncbi:papain-like cysteine protease family protein [Streptomyces lydicus]|uniref:papain-like cysteine protease family protein n=1 Tax=Streptomyces lydicus TaxID=47763 RepID=UPI003798FA2B